MKENSGKIILALKDLKYLLRTLVKLCQERAHDYFKRIKIEFHQWCVFGYPNSDPLCEREENSTTNRAVDKVDLTFRNHPLYRFIQALPPFFRCTREDCGKFRKLVDPEDCNPSYFICMDIKDPVSDFKNTTSLFFQRNITAANKPRKLLRRSRSKFYPISKQRFATLKKWPFLPSESDPPSKRKSTGRASPGRQLFAMRQFKTAAA